MDSGCLAKTYSKKNIWQIIKSFPAKVRTYTNVLSSLVFNPIFKVLAIVTRK